MNTKSSNTLDIASADPAANRPAPVPFATALRFWFWLGCVSFGGPAGQIAVMHAELVDRRRWISEKRFLHALNYCMVLPGPEAQQLATYIGWLLHGTRGGIAAGALFVLPSLAILMALTWAYLAFGQVPVIAGILYGIKPAVTAIVVHAAIRIGKRALNNAALWAIAAAAFVAIFALHLPFPLIVIGAAMLGYIGGRVAPERFRTGGGHGKSKASSAPSLIDDDTVVAHASYRSARLVSVLLIGLALWAAVYFALVASLGFDNPITRMASFFSGAALVTFGGAYAVLPYVFESAVNQFRWLSAPQMIDGLALGETTPGPLIMIVAFVGFVGGWQTDALAGALGPGHLFASAALAASVATWFTFLPSFVFILAGGPLVEATRDDLRLTAPLTGITAAVVGVILNLALFFAFHVLWPAGFGGTFEWPAALIGTAALIALLKYGVSVPKLIGVCALLGLAIQFGLR
ncbi:chromate efflux transporter [Nevskia sp.]|uniref:chromate efflux transporter n=1 Tax=Nevskia sp. TaxID=1929292 RepID=UPI0025F582C2|nr:chromate efflux transporter [Nevskia sp.]